MTWLVGPSCLPLVAAVCLVTACPPASRAQNDWQFPDPYFGVLEFEKSRPPGGERRPWAENATPPRQPAARPRLLRPRRRHVQQLKR